MPSPRRDRVLSVWAFIRRHEVTLLYVIIGALVIVGFHQQGVRDAKQCRDAKVNREAARQQVRDIADLGRNLSRGAPETIKQFDAYERMSLAKISTIYC